MIFEIVLVILFSYFIGSIPSGVIFAKIFNLEDLRTIGSGNTGTTNVLRTGNYTAAALTLIFDFGKACLTIYFTFLFNEDLIFISGVVTLIGHIFPVWLRFKGGKGFASYLGIISIVNIYLFLLISLVWLIVFFYKKISSLAALFSCLSCILLSIIIFKSNVMLVIVLTAIIILTHRENIKRLISGNESEIK